VAVGRNAGNDLVEGGYSTMIGYSALGGTLGTTADSSQSNTAIGYGAMGGGWADTATDNCVAIGVVALAGALDNVDGTVAIGHSALNALTTGAGNTAVGYNADKFNATGGGNTFIGYECGLGASGGNHNNNTALGGESLKAITTGASNVCVGKASGDLITTGSSNVLIGNQADVDAATDSFQVRIGHYGGVKFATGFIVLNDAYTGTPADGDAAHSNALFVIPAKSYISKVYVTVITLNANADADYMIVYDDTLDVASGAAISGYTEILGAGAESNAGIKVRSHDAQTAASDIDGGSGGVLKNTWVSDIDVTVDNSVGWVDTDVGIYIAHTKANTASDTGADTEIQITVEYTGVS
jgi:hypothetical protein